MVSADKLRAFYFADEGMNPLRGVDLFLRALVRNEIEKLIEAILASTDDPVRLVDEEASFQLFYARVLSRDALYLLVLSLNQVFWSIVYRPLCHLHCVYGFVEL